MAFIKRFLLFFIIFASLTFSIVLLYTKETKKNKETSGLHFIKTVNIGAVLPLTGDSADFGLQTRNGIQLSLEDIEAQGNSDFKIQVIYEDSQGDPTRTVAAVNKLINRDHVLALIGELTSTNTLAASILAEKRHIPLISPGATNEAVTRSKKFTIRTCFTDGQQGTVLADFTYKTLGLTSASLLLDKDSDFSIGIGKIFEDKFLSLGGQITQQVFYNHLTHDFKPQISKLSRKSGDIVFFPGSYQQVAAVLREAENSNLKSRFLGADEWDSPQLFALLKNNPQAFVGHFLSSHFFASDNDGFVKSFVEKHKKTFGEEPGHMAALGFDTMNFLYKNLEEEHENSEKLNIFIHKTKNFKGVTGLISIDEQGNADKPVLILKTTPQGFQRFDDKKF